MASFHNDKSICAQAIATTIRDILRKVKRRFDEERAAPREAVDAQPIYSPHPNFPVKKPPHVAPDIVLPAKTAAHGRQPLTGPKWQTFDSNVFPRFMRQNFVAK
tara:strand:+ start:1071 stop:1382 length:312 start_codon:yes stop_codon:yes gene_type:complete